MTIVNEMSNKNELCMLYMCTCNRCWFCLCGPGLHTAAVQEAHRPAVVDWWRLCVSEDDAELPPPVRLCAGSSSLCQHRHPALQQVEGLRWEHEVRGHLCLSPSETLYTLTIKKIKKTLDILFFCPSFHPLVFPMTLLWLCFLLAPGRRMAGSSCLRSTRSPCTSRSRAGSRWPSRPALLITS